jgi:epoxide hydrolase-like predicted phosphatase
MIEIEAVVFDFGGVYTPSPFEAVRTMGEVAGIDYDQAMLFVFGSYDRDTDHPWHRAERGELGLEEARNEIRDQARAQGLELDLYDMLRYMSGAAVRDDMVERTRRLRVEGYRVGMITNNVVEFREFWRPMLPLDELFDVVIDSSEVGMRKPDPRIFHLVLEQLGGVEPGRSVFLDDYPGNIEAAEAVGMHGVLVGPDHSAAISRLDVLLGG